MCLVLHIYSKINFTDLFTLVFSNVQGIYGGGDCFGVRKFRLNDIILKPIYKYYITS